MLMDYLVADPHMVRDLHTESSASSPFGFDGTGSGPLVVPGVAVSVALTCIAATATRGPAIAAQLRDTVGWPTEATLLATAALALSQVNRVIAAVRGRRRPEPSAEHRRFDRAGSIVARQWTRHPRCFVDVTSNPVVLLRTLVEIDA